MTISTLASFIFLPLLLIGLPTNGYSYKRKFGHGEKHYRSSEMISNSTIFDVLIFTQHWPQSVCFQWKEKTSKHTCNLPEGEEWSIHGIWPTQYHKTGPQYCNSKLHFDILALKSLEDKLTVKWIDVENGTKPYSFWRHEWIKHGTCAVSIEALNNELKYFGKGLEFLDTYDMKNVLGKCNIMPGQNYTLQEILDGVQKVLGVNSQVQCITNPKTKESYIFEIRICFDKALKLINCDGIAGFPSNCSYKKKLFYPGTVPTYYNVIQL